MNKSYSFTELKSLFTSVTEVKIFLPLNPDFDKVAAALALRLALIKQGKAVAVFSPTPMTVEFNRLVGVETIGENINSGRDLIISFNYPLEQIEKVSYNDDGGKLNLVVQPKERAPRPEKDQLIFSYQGGNKALPIMIGSGNLAIFGKLMDQIDLNEAVVISKTNEGISCKLPVIDEETSGFSEVVTGIISGLGWALDQDIANNLYQGLNKATNNFTSEAAGPETFEAIAVCLRWGAQRNLAREPVTAQPVFNKTGPAFQPKATFPTPQKINPLPSKESKAPPAGSQPSDWFEPKIFKSSNI